MQGDKKTVTQDYFDDCMGIKEASNLIFTRLSDGTVAIRSATNLVITDPIDVIVSELDTPTIVNPSFTEDVESSISIPVGTKRIELRARNAKADLQCSWVSGQTNTIYFTVPRGNSWEHDQLNTKTGLSLYIRASKDTVLEVHYWA